MCDDSFVLHERLQADTHHIGRFALCDLILMNESRYPWFILVPRRSGVSEIFELSMEDQQQLLLESSSLSSHLSIHYHPDKLNIAAIGNIVPQLHIHHIVRYESDPAWPRPVFSSACCATAYGKKCARWPIRAIARPEQTRKS